ncbi:MAG: hypothetical protein IJQ31_15485 [Thermoguttaceae bacterium]|nr:hypothetical protein [Thermoguttaceae bacterium]
MPDSTIYLRVIDASANRACEALRVIEDFVRFVQDDPFLVENLKTLRHRLVQNVLKFPMPERLAYRETEADVGTRIETKTEFSRSSLQAVLDANFSRLQESLRSLEEFSKLTQPEAAREFEQMRYASYTLQRVVFFTVTKDSPLRRLESKTLRAAEQGVWLAVGALKFTSDPQRAQEPEFAGFLRVSPTSETVKNVRNQLGAEKLIGVCAASVEEARAALLDGIDFLAAADEALARELERLTTLPVLVLG